MYPRYRTSFVAGRAVATATLTQEQRKAAANKANALAGLMLMRVKLALII